MIVLDPDVRPRAEAIELVRASVHLSDRVVVTGASGWFGRTALSLLWHAFGKEWVTGNVVATASSSRWIEVLGCGRLPVHEAAGISGEEFAPNVVVNCAFPTRNRVDDLGIEGYLRVASRLTNDLLVWTRLPSVERVVTLSSGAAVPSVKFPADLRSNPYGVLKAREEGLLLKTAGSLGKCGVVCRVWTVSGPHVQNPHNYALSSMVVEALRAGRVSVTSRAPVIRGYSSAEDIIAVSLAQTRCGSGVFNTGGAPVEMGELAARIAFRLGATVIRRDYDPSAPADDYRSTDGSWEDTCAAHALDAADLDEQLGAAVPGVATWM